MTAETLAQAFEPFYTTRLGSGGSGLGLYIVDTVIRGYGGRVAVESPGPGLGCTFIITIPV